MSVRTELNKIDLNRLAVDLQAVPLGEALTLVIAKLTPQETGVTPSSNVATLAAIPSALLQVNATSATTTGIKKLRKGVVGTDVPATGECVWQPGTKLVSFAAVDAVTAASFTYSVSTDKASCMESDV